MRVKNIRKNVHDALWDGRDAAQTIVKVKLSSIRHGFYLDGLSICPCNFGDRLADFFYLQHLNPFFDVYILYIIHSICMRVLHVFGKEVAFNLH